MDDNAGRSVGEPMEDVSSRNSESSKDSGQGNPATSSADVSPGASGLRERSEEPNLPDAVSGEQSDASDGISEELLRDVRVLFSAYKEFNRDNSVVQYCDDFNSFFESPSSQKRNDLHYKLRCHWKNLQMVLKDSYFLRRYTKETKEVDYEIYLADEALHIGLNLVTQSLVSILSVRSSPKVPSIQLSTQIFDGLISRIPGLGSPGSEVVPLMNRTILAAFNALKEVCNRFESIGTNSSPGSNSEPDEAMGSNSEPDEAMGSNSEPDEAMGSNFEPDESIGSNSAADESIGSNNLDGQISKRVSNARKLLLTVLTEVDENFSSSNIGSELITDFLQRRRTEFKKGIERRQMTLKYRAGAAYETLVRIVAQSLASTESVRSSRKFGTLMLNYRNYKKLHERFSEHWREGYPQDEDSRSIVEHLKKMERYLFLTRNAFNELLMHITECNVGKETEDCFKKMLFPENESFLRTEIS